MTITAEQAKALKAGISEGEWRKHGDGARVVSGQAFIATLPRAAASKGNSRAIAAVPDMLATIIAQGARIAELEARENEWRSAFWVADQFAVAIHDDAGKFYSIRAQDFHRMSDLYRGDISAARAALNGERT